MKALLQRVRRAAVSVDGSIVGQIGLGLVVLLGVAQGDGPTDAQKLAHRTLHLRLFSDAAGRFNRSALEVEAELLVVSQFTLLADIRRGRRPSFTRAAPAQVAEPLVERYLAHLRESGLRVEAGRFGAHMLVEIHNDGPVTILLDSKEEAPDP